MTYSIVARCPRTGQLGLAMQSYWFPVGAHAKEVRSGAGAVAHQSIGSAPHARMALRLLRDGVHAQAVLEALARDDPDWQFRQVGIVDTNGNAAAHTGDNAVGFASHVVAPGVACQANLMRTEGVPEAMLEAWHASADSELVDRLLRALVAAEEMGGDLRGRMSAVLLVAEPNREVLLFDLRVDHDTIDPLGKLAQLVTLRRAYLLASLGGQLRKSGNLSGALEAYRSACALAPEHAELRLYQAMMEASTGDMRSARQSADLAYELAPELRALIPRLVKAQQVQLEPDVVEALTK